MSELGSLRMGSATRLWIGLALLGIAAAVLWAVLAHRDPPPAGAGKDRRGAENAAVPVATAISRHADVSLYLNGLGSVMASNTVVVKSRVDGQLMALNFREGQIVQAGDVLAELDPRPFQVQLTQAEGELARDQAQLANARVDLDRYRTLLAQDSITSQQLDTQRALVRQLVGTVEADRGQVDSARLQLTYSRIVAPIGGRVGLRQVDVGNIIHATDSNGIVVITQLQPIQVVFAVPEDNVPRIQKGLTAGATLKVEAWDRAMQHRLATGTLLTLDNQIDPATGTIKLKAQFANADDALFPNQFVNARLLLEVQRGATVVPTAAILRGSQGTYVYVVNSNQTVSPRPVATGAVQGQDTAIASGLQTGERVVVDNTDKLREGSKVQPVHRDLAAAAGEAPS